MWKITFHETHENMGTFLKYSFSQEPQRCICQINIQAFSFSVDLNLFMP